MIIPSAAYTKWHVEASTQIDRQFFAVGNVQEVQLEFWLPDKRRTDLTNKAESVMDLLVDTGVIEDDNWQVIPRILLHGAGIDRKNPRVHILIKTCDLSNG